MTEAGVRSGIQSGAELEIELAQDLLEWVEGRSETGVAELESRIDGDSWLEAGARERLFSGDFERDVGALEAERAQRIEERFEGGLDYRASLEEQKIVGGACTVALTGVRTVISGWSDQLAFGGWAQADQARCDIASVLVRSHMALAHAAGARIVRASGLIDDYTVRNESFAVGAETYATTYHIGAPGSGVILET